MEPVIFTIVDIPNDVTGRDSERNFSLKLKRLQESFGALK